MEEERELVFPAFAYFLFGHVAFLRCIDAFYRP
jgi:hypothetical protein